MKSTASIVLGILFYCSVTSAQVTGQGTFGFSTERKAKLGNKSGAASCYSSLLSAPQTLSAYVASLNDNGTVDVNGVDTLDPTTPFQFSWGDGATTSGFFPQTHVYASTGQDYIIKVTATENNGTTQTVSFPVFFQAPPITPKVFSGVSVQIPSSPVEFQSHWPGYTPPTAVTEFPNTSFPIYSRSDVAYILTAVSSIDYSFANENSFLLDGVFQIEMLENTGFNPFAGISFWFTTPMSVGYAPPVLVGPGFPAPAINWWVLFNEIGKDTTLNTPTSLTYGGNTDGQAGEIYAETMGAIFSYAAGCQLISNAASYGIGADAALDLQNTMLSGAALLQGIYNQYVADGAPFTSWRPPNSEADPTIGTFTTLAWKFIEHAEMQGQGYQVPVQRMMKLLQLFDSSMLASYAPTENTAAAATFRSTLMVTALSYAFSQDLRDEFEALNFPIDNDTFEQLYETATGAPIFVIGPASGQPTSQTINAGQSAKFNLMVTPLGSFTGTLNLSCSIKPAVTTGATCSLSNSSMNITGSSGQPVTVTVGTTAATTTGTISHFDFPAGWMPMEWTGMLLVSAWLLLRNRGRLTVLAVPIIVLMFWVGCGGGNSPASQTTPGTPASPGAPVSQTTPGTPAGTYTATITATSGNLTSNTFVTVVVQ